MIGIFYKSSVIAEAGGGRGEEGAPFESFLRICCKSEKISKSL